MEKFIKYNKGKEVLNQVSWADWFTQDNYFGLKNSFQYSENINCDDELHWIKLSQKIKHYSHNSISDCQLVEAWDDIYAIPIKNWWKVYKFNKTNWNNISSMTEISGFTIPSPWSIPWWSTGNAWWVMFQNYLRCWVYVWNSHSQATWFFRIDENTSTWEVYIPYDHPDFTDESISDASTATLWNEMGDAVTAMINFNNTRLIVASWNSLRVYYPELDNTYDWKTWWKKVQTYRWWTFIVWLTCTFEYLKVRVQDHSYNTKVFFYQANNDFRSTFVYNQVDLKNTRVMRVYNINWIDYYTASLDGTDAFISLNKLIWTTPVPIFTRKGGLVSEDIFSKAWYFIGPTALDASYLDWNIYIADSHWVFKFKYNPSWKDTWYLKWKINNTKALVTWLAICQNYVYTSDEWGLHQMRLYDTWQDWYETTWILISREMEGNNFQWCFTKMLDEVKLNYELNPIIDWNWKIEVFISPNNTRTDTNPSGDGSDGWYKVMEITNNYKKTRTETITLVNNVINTNSLPGALSLDWQTITYLIKITKGSNNQATPIVREIQLRYHVKGKTNEVYDIRS